MDESSIDHCTTYRGHAWAICGMKATRKAFFCQGKKVSVVESYMEHKIKLSAPSKYSVLSALSLKQGILHCDIIEGTFNTATFFKFIDHTLNQMQLFPSLNSVIVMDNCHIHKHLDILHLIES